MKKRNPRRVALAVALLHSRAKGEGICLNESADDITDSADWWRAALLNCSAGHASWPATGL
ncbi:hypothetical protein [Dechloromonas sp. A34]|uniref:hypothetical protein n=1 Tax=Dechloromonas sp. A34 TaxID=447588 RepID=UPI0022487BF6|nr:hypothetical protein [Dechloromonas sp. A34]